MSDLKLPHSHNDGRRVLVGEVRRRPARGAVLVVCLSLVLLACFQSSSIFPFPRFPFQAGGHANGITEGQWRWGNVSLQT